MYKELLEDFYKAANTLDAEEIETLSANALSGLDKLANDEIDNLEKFAAEYEADIEKRAAAEDNDQAIGAAAVLGAGGLAGGGYLGVKKLKAMLPQWKVNSLEKKEIKAGVKAAKSKAVAEGAEKKKKLYTNEKESIIKKLRAGGATPTPPVVDPLTGKLVAPVIPVKGIDMKDSANPENLFNQANPNKDLIRRKQNILEMADKADTWLFGDKDPITGQRITEKEHFVKGTDGVKDPVTNKWIKGSGTKGKMVQTHKGNKFWVLGGLGAAGALIGNKIKNDRREAELRGATGRIR